MSSELSENTKISHYRVISRIGAGGMGEVYLAEDTRLGRKVAIKILADELTRNRDRLSRFDQEAYAASALNHPNIITVFEMGDEGGRHFIVTEFIDGVTLRKHLSGIPMEFSEVLSVAIQIAAALEDAHAAGIIHRDIKPENIMVRRNGHVKVLDFGLAKLTEAAQSDAEPDTEAVTRALVQTDTAVVMGTSQYMSPEQARGLPIDVRTDIWSFGVVLYEMAAGRPPFSGETKTDVIVAIAKTDPPPIARLAPDVPAEFEWIVMKALRKKVDERYQTIKELETDLKKLRQRISFETELERSTVPERSTSSFMPATDLANTEFGSPPHATSATAGVKLTDAGSASARVATGESFVGKFKRHKTAIAVGGLALVLIAVGLFVWSYRKRATLTDRDTILLSDVVNITGDSVFDGTLKQALAVQLGQSPFLNILSDERVREGLRFMGRSPDERITRDVARELCLRQGLKAFLVGSIANVGNRYAITLEAVNAQTGDVIASQTAEAENKEKVLSVLGEAAAELREKLGESLQSVQKYDAPIEQGTTGSLEALKAFSLGVEQQLKGKYLDAIPLLKRATELDPNFALAYGRMSSMYYNTRQNDLAAEASRKAFELRDRVSERERLYISAGYYDNVTGDLDNYLQTLEVWRRTYPRDASPANNQAVKLNELGRFEKALEAAAEATRLNPSSASGYSLQAAALLGLNRYDEAKKVIANAQAQKLDTTGMHRILYRIAFVQNDAATMKQQIDSMRGKPDEYAAQGWQSEAAAFLGQLKTAREFSNQAFESADRNDLKDVAAQIAVGSATRDALFGDCPQVKAETTKALAISHNPLMMANAANALATCGESSSAQALVAELARRAATDTLLNKILVPLVQARIELQKGNGAEAIELLETTRSYEGYAYFPIAYVRGQAYLSQRMGDEASAEFRKILDHRGSQPTSPIYALAHLGLARADALSGDVGKARKTYQSFFDIWKGADPDLPILQDARKEQSKLN